MQLYNSISALDLASLSGRNIDMVNGTGRPSHLIDPRKKKKEWILQMTKSIESDFKQHSPNLYFNNRAGYNSIINAIQGIPEFSKYQNLVDQNISHNTDLTALNLNKGPLQLMSKYFRHLEGKLGDVKFDISVKPNNSLARREEDEYRTLLKTYMELGKILESNGVGGIQEFIGQSGMEIPDNNEELEIQMQMSKPSQLAMFIKRTLREVNRLDLNDQKFAEADYNLVAFGATAIETVINQNGIPTKEVVDPRDLLVGYSNTEDARDVSEIGKYRMATINDIREQDKDGEFSKDDLKIIESFCMGKYGNDNYMSPQFMNGGDDIYGKFRCLVLDLYFYSYDEEVKISKKDKNGNLRVLPKDHGYYRGDDPAYTKETFKKNHPGKTLYRTTTQNVYKASWIVGTDFIWNYGLVKNIERPSTDIFKSVLPIHLICPLKKNGRTVSIIEEMIAVTERANRFWVKMEEAIATARPNGFELNMDSFIAAIEGLGPHGYTFEKAMQMAMEQNIIFTSTKGMGGAANGQKPFAERYGGLGPDFGQYFEGLQGCIYLLQEISGFSGAATGAPAKYTGKKVAELAVASADYSIKHLFRAKKTLYENVMKSCSRLLIDSIMYGDSEVLRNYIGDNAFDFIKENSNAYECMLMIEFRATDEEWQHIYDAASVALKTPLEQGGIAYPDYIKVVECETIEEAENIMRLLYNRNKRKYQQEQQRAIESNGEQQRLSAEASAQAQAQQLAAQLAHDRELVYIQTTAALDIKKAEFLYKIEEKKIDGLIKGDQINTQGTIDKEITHIQAKYNMDKMKGKDPVVKSKK
jgi:hypothetical protein